MFAGLDKIDWAELEHAYGPADDIPEILRGLVSHDPDTRELAYEDFIGGVHHQGDVYECTALCVPFLLEAVFSPDVPQRGELVRLVASVGGVDEHGVDTWDADEPDPFGNHPHIATARATVAAELPRLLGLFDDPDVAVRRALPDVLVACQDRWGATLPLLRERMTAEPDPHARAALVRAVGMIAAHLDDDAELDSALTWLASLAAEGDSPVVRLRALATLADTDPGALPPDVADLAVAAVREIDEPGIEALVRSLDTALGSRTADRTALTTELLSFPDKEIRRLGASLSATLVREWRGDHSRLVRRLGDLVCDPDMGKVAAEVLDGFGPEALPAADALVTVLDSTQRSSPLWLTTFASGPPGAGPAVRALAHSGDARAVPVVRWALELDHVPTDIGSLLYGIRSHAAELLPLIRARLRDLPDDARGGALLTAIGNLERAGADAVPDLVELLEAGRRSSGLFYAFRAIGPAAGAAVPLLRRLCDEHPFDAPLAVWRIAGDPEPALAEVSDSDDGMRLAAALGQEAASALPLIRKRLAAPQDAWARLRAAIALWEVGGDPEPVVPELIAAGRANSFCLAPAADCLAEIGPPARAAEGLLRNEIGQLRRHNKHVYLGDAVSEDVRLLTSCARALDRIAGVPDAPVPARP
ncbi:hypothetical protein [Allokutzneria oryzae]|uniref:HEAT repeat domain-containing protein n=1 Tax=Allokutzneria oryzae TaxID=1378989 RepID=A0ABV6A2Z2_9PSEU